MSTLRLLHFILQLLDREHDMSSEHRTRMHAYR